MPQTRFLGMTEPLSRNFSSFFLEKLSSILGKKIVFSVLLIPWMIVSEGTECSRWNLLLWKMQTLWFFCALVVPLPPPPHHHLCSYFLLNVNNASSKKNISFCVLFFGLHCTCHLTLFHDSAYCSFTVNTGFFYNTLGTFFLMTHVLCSVIANEHYILFNRMNFSHALITFCLECMAHDW